MLEYLKLNESDLDAAYRAKLKEHRDYVLEYGEDPA